MVRRVGISAQHETHVGRISIVHRWDADTRGGGVRSSHRMRFVYDVGHSEGYHSNYGRRSSFGGGSTGPRSRRRMCRSAKGKQRQVQSEDGCQRFFPRGGHIPLQRLHCEMCRCGFDRHVTDRESDVASRRFHRDARGFHRGAKRQRSSHSSCAPLSGRLEHGVCATRPRARKA